MRPLSLAYILLGVLIFAATYRFLNQSPFPIPPDQFYVSGSIPFEKKLDPLPIYKDESRLQDGDLAPANANPDEPAIATDKAQLEDRNDVTPTNQSSDPRAAEKNLSYLADYAYSEVPPETKPADTVLKSLDDMPRGTPVEEIKRVADAFGMDFNFMKAVAKIESDFNPKQRTGSYIGLFQLSNAEFQQYGSGDILDPRDNAVAAAY